MILVGCCWRYLQCIEGYPRVESSWRRTIQGICVPAAQFLREVSIAQLEELAGIQREETPLSEPAQEAPQETQGSGGDMV